MRSSHRVVLMYSDLIHARRCSKMTEVLGRERLSPDEQLKMRADLFARTCLSFPSYSSFREWVGHPVKPPEVAPPSRATLQRSVRIRHSLPGQQTVLLHCQSLVVEHKTSSSGAGFKKMECKSMVIECSRGHKCSRGQRCCKGQRCCRETNCCSESEKVPHRLSCRSHYPYVRFIQFISVLR